ncbi:MarR family winged helix-turn-helix transcriptional regulator [Gemmatimonadota bacterium]
MSTRYQGSEEEIRALDTYIKLMRATGSVTYRAHTHLVEEKLTPSQFGVLEALFHLGPLVQRDLAEKLLVTGGNITMVVDNLEKRGLVLRKRDSDDRRFIYVYLTARGNELIGRIFPMHADVIRRELMALTADEQNLLGKLCKKLGRKDT